MESCFCPAKPTRHSDDCSRQRQNQQQRPTRWSSLCASPVSEHLNPEQECHGFHRVMQFRRVSHHVEIYQHLQDDDRHWGTREARVRRGSGKAAFLHKVLERKRVFFRITETHARSKSYIRHKTIGMMMTVCFTPRTQIRFTLP